MEGCKPAAPVTESRRVQGLKVSYWGGGWGEATPQATLRSHPAASGAGICRMSPGRPGSGNKAAGSPAAAGPQRAPHKAGAAPGAPGARAQRLPDARG